MSAVLDAQSSPPFVTVVLPAYNEQSDLPLLIDRVAKQLYKLANPFRILVVDDGSQDMTRAVALHRAQYWPVDVISHASNMGLGGAIRTGLKSAASTGGFIVTMDADNSHDPALIPEMLARLEEGADVVIASRFQKGGKVVGVPWHRRFLSAGASVLFRATAGVKGVRDYSSGYRAYRADVIRQAQECYDGNLVSERGFACMFEILMKLCRVDATFAEVPLVLRYDQKLGESKLCISKTIGRYAVVAWNELLRPYRGARRMKLARAS